MSHESLIHYYNRLKGNAISVDKLKHLHKRVQTALDSNGHGAYTTDLKGILERVAKAIKNMIASNADVAERVELLPIDINKSRLGEIAKEEPLRSKQLRAMYARLNNGGENLPKDKPRKADVEPKRESEKDIKRKNFKPRSRGKLPTPERKQLDSYVNDIDRETARRAYYWTSFSPERRGDGFREEYAQMLMDFRNELKPRADKMGMSSEFESDFSSFRTKLKKLATAYLHSHANVASSMITGPSKFPVEKNRKRGQWADNKLNEFFAYDKKIRGVLKNKYTPAELKPVKTGQEGALEILEKKLENAKKSHVFMKAANAIIRSKKNVEERLQSELNISASQVTKLLTPDYANRKGIPQYMLTNNLAEIKRLEARVNEVKKLNTKREEGNKEKSFEGGSVVYNYGENRLQILFDQKPDEKMRTLLKSNGFKWAPSQSAWQRQLTPNAKWVFDRSVVPVLWPGKKEELEGIKPQKKQQTAKAKLSVKKTEALPSVDPNGTSKKKNHLSGPVDASVLGSIPFKKIEITEPYKRDLHKLYSDTLMMFWGLPGSGKTVYLLKFAQYLAEKMGMSVLYIANEEWGRSTLADKINEFKIGHPKLKLAKDLTGVDLNQYEVVFMDSVQTLGFDVKRFKQFVENNPGRIYIAVIQSTKDGDFRGGKDWEHEVDIAGEVVNRRLILRKNRLDPDNSRKADKLMETELINDQLKKQKIRDAVKAQTKPVEPNKTATTT